MNDEYAPAPQDDEDSEAEGVKGGGILTRPLLAGLIAGLAAVLVIFAFGPSAPPPPAIDVPISASAPAPAETQEPQAAPADAAGAEETAPKTETEAPPPADVPVVAEAAIVITDVGLNRRVAEAIDKKLPRDVTLAISPYATDPGGTAAAFKASGRDIWMQMAAQSVKGGIDPGPIALAGGLSPKENADLIKKQLELAAGHAAGIFVPDDADITFEERMWTQLATDSIAQNTMVLDATKAKVATSLYVQKSEQNISAYLKADRVIEADMAPAAFKAALESAVPFIISERQAIIVVRDPTVLSIDTMEVWIKGFGAKGIRLVPATRFTGLKP